MKKHILLPTLLLALTLASCDDFVDVIPKGNTIPTTVDDLGKLMANGSMAIDGTLYEFTSVAYGLLYMNLYSDDYAPTEDPNSLYYYTFSSVSMVYNLITWADYIYSAAESDYNWDGLYKGIYIVDYVLDHIDEVDDGMSYDRSEVKGQALVHRAMDYFLLTNLYGAQYDAATAATELSVPLVLEADINKQYPRATVAEVYDQILSDLNQALDLLTIDVPDYNNLPGRATAYALRSRVHLWMQDYDSAYDDACQALSLRSTLTDYNGLSAYLPGIPAYGISGYDTSIQTNEEVMYSRYTTESLKVGYADKMLALIDQENDLRYTLFVGALEISSILEPVVWTRHCHSGINVSEVWLTRAEAALRKTNPNVTDALYALNYLRKHRYASSSYEDYTQTDADALLNEILVERRRELGFCEMPFFDRKRLNADPTTAQAMERSYLGVTYTMPVGDSHYSLAIPLNVMALNSQLVQNER